MTDSARTPDSKVEAFPEPVQSRIVSEELTRLLEFLKNEFPNASNINFEFDGKLHVHIDVRMSEEIAKIEARLAIVKADTFAQIRHGRTPGRAFLHRVSALVGR